MSIITQAQYEMTRAGWDDDDKQAMTDCLRRFLDYWDSGGAVAAAAPVFQRLLAGKPLGPLTGDDDEWVVLDYYDGHGFAQNRRCNSVFKRRDGVAYDIDAHDPRAPISFPYYPENDRIGMPIVEILTTEE